MLDVVRSAARRRALAAAFDVEILSLATANPPFRLPQSEAAVYAKELYPQLSKLWQLYDNTGIECRYNCEPIEWYLRPHSWEERTESFRRHALDLLEQITVKTTEAAGVALNDVDMIVTNTVTGLAIPSLDAMLLTGSNWRLRLSDYRSSVSVAAPESPALPALPAWLMPRTARWFCFSQWISAACVCASTIRVRQCLSPPPYSATVQPACYCTTPGVARGQGRAFLRTANGAGEIPSTSW